MNKLNQKKSLADPQDSVRDIPEEVFRSIEEEVAAAGGELRESPEYEGAIGRTMFDTPSSDDGTVTVLLPTEKIDTVPSQCLLRIRSIPDKRSYLAAVVKGPFAEPDGLRGDAPILVTVTVKGSIMLPKYHGRIQVGLIGEELADGTVVPPRRRPKPNSPVFTLTVEETERVLRTAGDIRVGLAEGHESVEIKISSKNKSLFPRHTGVLGTTGGGKSTTISEMISQLQEAKATTVIIDTEGEYTAIDELTDDPKMKAALERRGLKPAGIKDTHIYYLVGRETANPSHKRKIKFRLDFSDLSPYAFKEILEFTPAQETRFFNAFDACKLLLKDLSIYPVRGNRAEEQEALEIDEQETGYRRMTLSQIIDIAGAFLHKVSKAEGDPHPYNRVFQTNLAQVKQRINQVQTDSEISWRALLVKLWQLHRLEIFDNPGAQSINFQTMLQSGRVSIIDLSDTESPIVKNLVIAQILRGIHQQQDENYKTANSEGKTPNLTTIFIEEAHEFLSQQRIKDMPVLFQQVARIARRGRKRWLGLVFISQLPQHLPDEVLGLINNWVLHKIGDSHVISRLKHSISGIDDALWSRLPALAQGQAIVSFTSLSRPLLVTIDPTPCKLLMWE